MSRSPHKAVFPRILFALLLLAAVASYFLFLKPGGPASNSAMAGMGGPAPVSVATVIHKPVTQWKQFSGILESVNKAEIRPRVSGQITGIHFTDGAEVKKGHALFTIDTRTYEAEAKRAKGNVAAASAALANAQQEFSRAAKLVKTKAISQSEFDLRASQLKQARGALDAASGALATAEVNLGYANITAPISGKISRAELTVGNQVEGGPGAPLLASIVTLSPIYASFEIDESTFVSTIQGVAAAKLKAIPVEVSLGNGRSDALPATIHSFDNQITPGSGTIRVRATLENADQTLLPGLFANVRMGTPEAMEVILIHAAAVNTDQDKKNVFVVGEGNKVEYREVTLGSIADGLQIITSGLKPGEKIVVNGLQRVQPGTPVLPTDVDMLHLKPLNVPVAPIPPAAAETR